jgi:hypothetical protein
MTHYYKSDSKSSTKKSGEDNPFGEVFEKQSREFEVVGWHPIMTS